MRACGWPGCQRGDVEVGQADMCRRPIYVRLSPTRTFKKKAPGEFIPGGLLDRRDWVHPPSRRCSSKHLAAQSCAVCGNGASLA
jgi:hypothetical protein